MMATPVSNSSRCCMGRHLPLNWITNEYAYVLIQMCAIKQMRRVAVGYDWVIFNRI